MLLRHDLQSTALTSLHVPSEWGEHSERTTRYRFVRGTSDIEKRAFVRPFKLRTHTRWAQLRTAAVATVAWNHRIAQSEWYRVDPLRCCALKSAQSLCAADADKRKTVQCGHRTKRE